MTPEETKAMADRIAANRREAAAKVIPIKNKTPDKVKIPVKKIPAKSSSKPSTGKAKPKAKKTPKAKARVKPIGPGTSAFKFKPLPKSREVCDVLTCREKPKAGFRCAKHKKIIRKAQLKANNVIWKKRVKAGTAGHHAVYTYEDTQLATKFAIKQTDKMEKVVKDGHSIIPTVGKFKEIVSKTKQLRAKAKKKAA